MLNTLMEQLVKKAREGDKQAEKKIFDILFVRFTYFAKHRIGNDDCEDLAQEACLTVLKKYRTVRFSTSFQAWAYGVLRMKIGNYLQSKQRLSGKQISLIEVINLTPASNPDPDFKRRLIECLKKIARTCNNYARILNFSYQGFSAEIICQKLDIKISNYYVTLNRGRTKLKECLEKEGVFK